MPVSVPCDGETPLAFLVLGNEELVGHEATSKAQQYGARRHLSARGGGKILANDNLPHEVSQDFDYVFVLSRLKIATSADKSRIRSFSIRARKLANYL